MSGSSLARALLALAALGLVACAGGPHGPDELVLVPVPGVTDEALPACCRVAAHVDLGAGSWELRLPLPLDDDAQRVESLLVLAGPGAETDAAEGGGLRVRGAGPVALRWRARVVPTLAPPGDLPAAALAVPPLDTLDAWVAALGAAGVEARLRHGLLLDAGGGARPGDWVEVRAASGWVALGADGAPLRDARRVALDTDPPQARHNGEPAALDVAYQLRVE